MCVILASLRALSVMWRVDGVSELLLRLVAQSARQASRGLVVFGAVPVGAIPARLAFPDKPGTGQCRIPAPAIGLAGEGANLNHAQRRVGGERFRQQLLSSHQAEAEAPRQRFFRTPKIGRVIVAVPAARKPCCIDRSQRTAAGHGEIRNRVYSL